jgi:LAO/AO transport system kinase
MREEHLMKTCSETDTKGVLKIVEDVLAGNIRAVARLIRDIDNGRPETRSTLKALHPHTGNAYVLGITGAPGVGKSTLVDQMVRHLRKKEKTVGVLAVDPSSPFSGGAILGDRIRMQRHSTDQGVYIRSLATRGQFGGVTQSTIAAIDVLDAMGKDYIIVETVGVGQGEIDVVKSADTTIIVVIPGMGDGIQAVKAGILEAGDLFLINKSDKEGARRTLMDLTTMIEMNPDKYKNGAWKPPVLMAEAKYDKGVVALLNKVEKHREHVKFLPASLKRQYNEERTRTELTEMIKKRIVEDVLKDLALSGELKNAVDAILDGTKDPYSACDELVLPKIRVERT